MRWSRRRSGLLVVIVAVVVGGVTALAQLPRTAPDERILTGGDVGFRVEGSDPRTGQPTGTWVVRLNGRWVEAHAAAGIRPAK